MARDAGFAWPEASPEGRGGRSRLREPRPSLGTGNNEDGGEHEGEHEGEGEGEGEDEDEHEDEDEDEGEDEDEDEDEGEDGPTPDGCVPC